MIEKESLNKIMSAMTPILPKEMSKNEAVTAALNQINNGLYKEVEREYIVDMLLAYSESASISVHRCLFDTTPLLDILKDGDMKLERSDFLKTATDFSSSLTFLDLYTSSKGVATETKIIISHQNMIAILIRAICDILKCTLPQTVSRKNAFELFKLYFNGSSETAQYAKIDLSTGVIQERTYNIDSSKDCDALQKSFGSSKTDLWVNPRTEAIIARAKYTYASGRIQKLVYTTVAPPTEIVKTERFSDKYRFVENDIYHFEEVSLLKEPVFTKRIRLVNVNTSGKDMVSAIDLSYWSSAVNFIVNTHPNDRKNFIKDFFVMDTLLSGFSYKAVYNRFLNYCLSHGGINNVSLGFRQDLLLFSSKSNPTLI